jgi:hypothetical protein
VAASSNARCGPPRFGRPHARVASRREVAHVASGREVAQFARCGGALGADRGRHLARPRHRRADDQPIQERPLLLPVRYSTVAPLGEERNPAVNTVAVRHAGERPPRDRPPR